jgi:excisionase family DNA binding protein
MQRNPLLVEKPLAYQINQFCRLIGIGRSHFYELVKDGKIRTVMLGGRRVVPASEGDRLLSGCDDVSPNSLAA